MTEEAKLIQKREELKRQLVTGEYKTLIDIVFEGMGHIIQKLTRKPPPSFWVALAAYARFCTREF